MACLGRGIGVCFYGESWPRRQFKIEVKVKLKLHKNCHKYPNLVRNKK